MFRHSVCHKSVAEKHWLAKPFVLQSEVTQLCNSTETSPGQVLLTTCKRIA